MRAQSSVGFLLLLTLTSCSDAPAPAAKGTPPFYWQAAQETFAAGDYLKTNDHLEQLVKSQNEFTDRARPWRLIVLAGLLGANIDVANKFEYGGRENRTNPAPFRKQTNDSRSMSGNLAMQLLESWQKFKAAKPAEVVLDFPFPAGNTAAVAPLVQVSKGILIAGPDIESARRAAMQRGVVLAVTDAVGAGDDAAKAREILKTRPAKVPAPVFSQAMASALYEGALTFDSRKLDRPDVMKALCNEALEVLKDVPDSKSKKELATRIQDTLKRATKKA